MSPRRTPSRPVLAAAGTGAALAAVTLEARVLEPRRLVVREVTLRLSPWPAALAGLRVALVADVHAGSPGVPLARVRRLVERVVALRPDLVLLLGDHLADVRGGRHLDPADVAAALSGLRAVGPVAGVLGNHDWYAGGARVRHALDACGLPVLEESSLPVDVLGTTVWLAGVGDLWERRPSVRQALADVPLGEPTILLTHNPDVVLDVPRSVSLTVAGHTHAGQVAFGGRPVHHVSPFTGNRLLRGAYDVDGRTLYVTSGVGTSLVPWRLGVVPELVVLTLHPRVR